MQPQPVSINQTTEISCVECSGTFFNMVHCLRKVSRVITMTAEDQIIPIPVFVCNECGTVVNESMPELFKQQEPKPKAKILNLEGDSI